MLKVCVAAGRCKLDFRNGWERHKVGPPHALDPNSQHEPRIPAVEVNPRMEFITRRGSCIFTGIHGSSLFFCFQIPYSEIQSDFKMLCEKINVMHVRYLDKSSNIKYASALPSILNLLQI